MLTAIAGTASVFTFAVYMNQAVEPPGLDWRPQVSAFAIAPSPPPERKPSAEPRVAPVASRRAVKTDSRAPLPYLPSSISAAGFHMPNPDDPDGMTEDSARRILGSGPARQLVMTEAAVDTPPRPSARTAPVYPELARARGVDGHVTVQILVTAAGDVGQVKVLDARPAGVFEQAAVQAVRGWRFAPGIYGGQAVSSWVTQTIRFQLR